MINFESVSHINIVVDDIERATEFYFRVFRAIPIQEFPHFRNIGFAKSAGFVENPEDVDVTIRFLRIPTKEGLVLELMRYFSPDGQNVGIEKITNGIGYVGHIALRVTNIDESFEFLKSLDDVRLISDHPEYKPFKIDMIEPSEFLFFDPELEASIDEKRKVCEIIGGIKYFYFVDPWNVQWELEQAPSDMENE
ncbi:MAG: maltose O-acetyltransferase [Candidatus Methanomarinus sp.]|jgi:maltose O-acetyltransferase|nr:MAG: maltose O-acetyltransferase [ANME-2 cluster archaeon]